MTASWTNPHGAVLAAVALAAGLCLPGGLGAVTPESPEVKAAIGKALAFLEKQDDERLGGKCLIGLCFFKAEKGPNHPKIAAALAACEKALGAPTNEDNYSVGLALIFLCEVDPSRHRLLAERYVKILLERQQEGGGWGYPGNDHGDTSQTQYPVLGLWLAANSGIDVPNTAIEKACGWLLRTQDPYGAWGYQGEDPGKYQRVPQNEVRASLGAAGLGALYISCEFLGITTAPVTAAGEAAPALPAALKVVEDAQPVARRKTYVTRVIDHALARRAMTDGDNWMQKNLHGDAGQWFHYYLYALERYHSFRESALKLNDQEPKWYNEMFAKLQKEQQAAGNWEGNDNAVIATAFGTLFLLRSARKTLAHVAQRSSEGVLLGGMGLPKSTADLRERDGKIVETPFAGTVDELIALISNPDHPDFANLSDTTGAVALDSDVTKRSGQIAQLRAIVTAGTVDSRLIAIRTLGRVRELDNVPVLIHAFTTNEPRLVRATDQALRFISRKFGGVGLPDEPQEGDIKAAAAAWKAWYLSIRPTAEFLD
ncbi:MAG TPA: hypothetical protein VFB80_03845 [Pirellulaceae bacterium]|nr:hypothetical protein [Pirellulaceae bacterium]